jgi:3-oxoacyl-[acyl-carrier protein] reductase
MKTAIVTGGARGIGLVIAQKLAAEDVRVIVWDVKEPTSDDISFEKCDVTSFSQVKEMASQTGDIDILINNAGITRDKLLMRMKEEDWDRVIDVNLKGTFNCVHAFLPGMIRKRGGRIVNISSIIGLIGNAGQSNYAASKAGIIGFTKSIAREVASRNVTCNAITPGYILTEMTENLPSQVKEAFVKSIPLGRPGTPDDVANVVRFLVSEEANYITGQVLNVDGGMVM